ncbi:MAG: PIN domain-containing protein [Gammaproteobacteria bacterium]|nr:PIN domain-containing protein [Gammaproteobacteria bacterium]MDP2349434.1 PIN domain-containing protein [Gammaproteobacteria bacterium]
MRALLDVNVLIALLDSSHVHHTQAMHWLRAHITEGWASCPITQNGCIRIMSQAAYPNSRSPVEISSRLRDATLSPQHEFWPDKVSLLDSSLFDWQQLFNARQLTDAYLLALAVRHSGVFVTFDHAVPIRAVSGAGPEHLVLI